MLTSKQRAKLKGIASKLDPIFQIGKDGISDAQLSGMAEALKRRELIKITVLRSSESSAKELIAEVAERLNAIPVAAIGSKIIIYKRSSDKDIEHIQL